MTVDLPPWIQHGTTAYTHYGCRCDECRGAWAAAHAKLIRHRRGLPPGDPRHGTTNGYRNWRCACDLCVEANRRDHADWVSRRSPLAADDPRHGSVNGYTNYGCRCDACKAGYSERRRRVAS